LRDGFALLEFDTRQQDEPDVIGEILCIPIGVFVQNNCISSFSIAVSAGARNSARLP
jgi:hypothetical protein